MTRETKIGLLVGLAFIIVIGILLSDHLTSSTDPPQAQLAGAGNNVRQAVTTPGQPAPQLPQVAAPTNSGPNRPVPTQSELTPSQNPISIVKVGPSNNAGATPTIANAPTQANPQDATAQATSDSGNQPSPQTEQGPVAGADPPTITKITPSGSPIDGVARQHGEELVLLDNNGRAIRSGKPAPRGAMAEYKAEPGDSLSKMAQKLMGSNSGANRAAIIAANPSLKTDPNKVIVGRTYLIPTSPESTAAVLNNSAPPPVVSAPPVESPSKTEAQPLASNEPRETGQYWYTVKEGDTLWRIAKEQLGKGGAWASIKELNKDVLIGEKHEDVVTGMKLRLPSKPIASAS